MEILTFINIYFYIFGVKIFSVDIKIITNILKTFKIYYGKIFNYPC